MKKVFSVCLAIAMILATALSTQWNIVSYADSDANVVFVADFETQATRDAFKSGTYNFFNPTYDAALDCKATGDAGMRITFHNPANANLQDFYASFSAPVDISNADYMMFYIKNEGTHPVAFNAVGSQAFVVSKDTYQYTDSPDFWKDYPGYVYIRAHDFNNYPAQRFDTKTNAWVAASREQAGGETNDQNPGVTIPAGFDGLIRIPLSDTERIDSSLGFGFNMACGTTATLMNEYDAKSIVIDDVAFVGSKLSGAGAQTLSAYIQNALTPVAPNGLLGIAVSGEGKADGKIKNVTDLMEYKKASDDTYTQCSGTEIPNLPVGAYDIRFRMTDTRLASAPVSIMVPDVPTAPDAPSSLRSTAVTEKGSDGTISGVTQAMEYRKSTQSGYTKCTGTTIEGLDAGTYLVRVQAVEGMPAGVDAVVTVGEYVVPLLKTKMLINFDKASHLNKFASGTYNFFNPSYLACDDVRATGKALRVIFGKPETANLQDYYYDFGGVTRDFSQAEYVMFYCKNEGTYPLGFSFGTQAFVVNDDTVDLTDSPSFWKDYQGFIYISSHNFDAYPAQTYQKQTGKWVAMSRESAGEGAGAANPGFTMPAGFEGLVRIPLASSERITNSYGIGFRMAAGTNADGAKFTDMSFVLDDVSLLGEGIDGDNVLSLTDYIKSVYEPHDPSQPQTTAPTTNTTPTKNQQTTTSVVSVGEQQPDTGTANVIMPLCAMLLAMGAAIFVARKK